jgi:hypothetical protein
VVTRTRRFGGDNAVQTENRVARLDGVIKSNRKRYSLTQVQLAERLNITPRYLIKGRNLGALHGDIRACCAYLRLISSRFGSPYGDPGDPSPDSDPDAS